MDKVKKLQSLSRADCLLNTTPLKVDFLSSVSTQQANNDGHRADVLVVANADYLLIFPNQGNIANVLSRLSAISQDMTVFSRRELTWNVDAKLKQAYIYTLLQANLDIQYDRSPTGVVYIYINGMFQKRFFPAVLARAFETADINIHRTYDERLFNPKTTAISRAFGEHSLANLIIHYDSAGGSCSCFDNKLNVIGIGRGTTKRMLLLGAIYEYLERRVSGELPTERHTASLKTTDSSYLSPGKLYACTDEEHAVFFPRFSADKTIEWVKGIDIQTRRTVWLPAAMVYYLDVSQPKFSFNTNSNGCALGNSVYEALYYALLELIERDALLVTWYTRSSPVRLVLDQTLPSSTNIQIKKMECEGYAVHLFDISNDTRTPVVLVVLEGQKDDSMAAFVTGSAHTNPLTAVETAVAEAYSLFQLCERNYLNPKKHDGSGQSNTEQYFVYADPKNKDKFDFIFSTPHSQRLGDFLNHHQYPTTKNSPLDLLLTHLTNAGYRPVYTENCPSYLKDLGLTWVRAYVPEFINLVFGDNPVYVSPTRIKKASAYRRWINNCRVDSQPILHPLG